VGRLQFARKFFSIESHEIIEEYPDDKPYASYLMLGWHKNRSLHVVIADNPEDDETVVITVYEPDLQKWQPGYKEKIMKCVICKHGEVIMGYATLTLEHGGLTMLVKHVPARVCDNCGEEYVEEEIAARVFKTARQIAESGAQLEIREYQAA
jgi:YgiT-type zinc finger domain-containing protein